MLCRIADLIVEVPDTGGLASRCWNYAIDVNLKPDIIIRKERLYSEKYQGKLSENNIAYLESTNQFCHQIIYYNGIYFHASAIEVDGRAYLFCGNSGTGKSTHSRLWKQLLGDAACIINDDKPIVRLIDGELYVYGTPWCGKDGINANKKVPLAGLCVLKQASENRIRQYTPFEALTKIMPFTLHKWRSVEKMEKMAAVLDHIVNNIPVYELENKPDLDAAKLSYTTLCKRTEETNNETENRICITQDC